MDLFSIGMAEKSHTTKQFQGRKKSLSSTRVSEEVEQGEKNIF